jgi:hypothetical protein
MLKYYFKKKLKNLEVKLKFNYWLIWILLKKNEK